MFCRPLAICRVLPSSTCLRTVLVNQCIIVARIALKLKELKPAMTDIKQAGVQTSGKIAAGGAGNLPTQVLGVPAPIYPSLHRHVAPVEGGGLSIQSALMSQGLGSTAQPLISAHMKDGSRHA